MPDYHRRKARLASVTLPEFGTPSNQPELEDVSYNDRYERFIKRFREFGADAGIIYADREHCANLAWLSGFDPRFEEALLIALPDKEPVLLTGPENIGVGSFSPLPMDVHLYPPMGLMGQDRSGTPPLEDLLRQAGLSKGMKLAVCGWKYFSRHEHDAPQGWLEIPAYIAGTLAKICGGEGYLFNGGSIFMDPEQGLRATNSIDELARYEFAACHTSSAIQTVVRNTRPGMSEFEAAKLMQTMGLPLTCHPMLTAGERAFYGLLSPSSRIMKQGDPITTAYGVTGALNCRAGWLAEDEGDLPQSVRDYIDVLVIPYFEAIVEWLETIEIGMEGKQLDQIIRTRLGDPFFGVKLNPGHLIHLEEWMHSPIARDSTDRLKSGMAIQVDVIPSTGTPYFTTNIEDGIALLDENDRAQFAEEHPAAWQRIEHRRNFMEESLGIRLKPDCLPFSNIPGWLPPFWLSPDQIMTMK